MCSAEKARSLGLSSVRSNSETTGPYVVLVPPLLVPPMFVFRRWYWGGAVSTGGATSNPTTIAISWIALGSFVFVRCDGYEKSLDCTRTMAVTALSRSRYPRLVSVAKPCGVLNPRPKKPAAQQRGATIRFLCQHCESSRSFALIFIYGDKLFAQLNGCVRSTSQAYARLR